MRVFNFFLLIAGLIACQATSAQPMQVSGTIASIDISNSPLTISPHDPRMFVNEEMEAFLLVEQKALTPRQYEELLPHMFNTENPMMQGDIQTPSGTGKWYKALFNNQEKKYIFWFAYIGEAQTVVDIKGGYAAERDEALHDIFQKIIHSFSIEPVSEKDPFEQLPFTLDMHTHGFVDEGYDIPMTIALGREDDTSHELLMVSYDKTPCDKLEKMERTFRHNDKVITKDRKITFQWGPNEADEADTMIFLAYITYPDGCIQVTGFGAFTPDNITTFRTMTLSVQRK